VKLFFSDYCGKQEVKKPTDKLQTFRSEPTKPQFKALTAIKPEATKPNYSHL
jgi:hypothetical protein